MLVVTVRDSATAGTVLECLRSWSDAGLLRPFCWWSSEAGAVGDHCLRVEGGTAAPTELFAALEGQAVGVGVLAVSIAGAGQAFDQTFARDAVTCRALLLRALPQDYAGLPVFVSVAVPGAIGQAVPSELFISSWDAAVYVAPEDLSRPGDVNRLLRDEARFIAHAAHAVASVGDLWVHTGNRSALDTIRRRVQNRLDYVQVVRCFTRVIDGGFLADDLAATLLSPAPSWPVPSREGANRQFKQVAMTPHLSDYLVDEFFTKHAHALGLSAVPAVIDARPHLALWEAIKKFLRELVDNLTGRALARLEHEVGTRYDRLAEITERATGERVQRWSDDPRATDGPRIRKLPLVFPADGPVNETWDDFCALAFRLMDGKQLPAGIDDARALLQGDSVRGVVTDPRSIVPDPAMALPPEAATDAAARVCDPLRFDPVFSAPQAAAPNPADESGDDRKPAEPPGESDAADAFLASASGTLVWAIGRRLGRGINRAAREQADAERAEAEAQRNGMPTMADVERVARQSRRRFWTIFLVAGAVWCVATWAAWRFASGDARALWLVTLWLAWFAVVVGAALSAHQQIKRMHEEVLRAYEESVARQLIIFLRERDVARLGRRYVEYLDWAEIVGWLAHMPVVAEPKVGAVGPGPVIAGAGLPAACQTAVGVVPPERFEVLCHQAGAVLFSSAWLSKLFDDVTVRAMTGLLVRNEGIADHVSAGVSLPDPFGDQSSDSATSPRAWLVARIREGVDRAILVSSLAQALLDFLQHSPVNGIFGCVDANGAAEPGPGAAGVSPSTFLAPLSGRVASVFLADHWVAAGGADEASRRVEPFIDPPELEAGASQVGLGALAVHLGYGHRLWCVVRRVDMAEVTPMNTLVAITEVDVSADPGRDLEPANEGPSVAADVNDLVGLNPG